MFHTCATRFDGTKQGLNETHETEWHQNFHISEKKHRGQQHTGGPFFVLPS